VVAVVVDIEVSRVVGCAVNYLQLNCDRNYSANLADMADPLDDPRLTLAGLFHETSDGLRLEFERRLAADSGLSVAWFEVLLRLARSEGRRLRLSELAAQTLFTRSGLSRLVDSLESAGLVERTACPSDRRGTFAQLTPAGLARIRGALPDHLDQIDAHLIGQLEPGERAQLEAVLRKIRDHIHPDARPTSEATPPGASSHRAIAESSA
jgi:DNA-binding MarR family transcriptional regulator